MNKLNHLAIIPDGNRRWAKQHNVSLKIAYRKGIEKFWDIAKWMKKYVINTITLWLFSKENFARSESEKSTLWQLFDHFLTEGLKRYEHNPRDEFKQVKVKFYGNLDIIPSYIVKKIHKVMDLTAENKPYKVNFMMGYGGRDEIVRAVNKIISEGVKHVNEELFSKYVDLDSDPDLVIRTGNVTRTSGFLLWNTVYSEFYFSKVLWPDFNEKEFEEAINYYKSVKRNFGR